jgi:MFS family permease
VRTYRELFALPEFRTLFLAQCLNVASSAVGGLALGTITYAATGNPVLSGLAMFGGPLVRLLASWFLLSASDLMRPRTALGLTAAVGCVADALQAIPGMPWGLRFVILALPYVVMSATGGAAQALVADLLPPDSFVFGRATLNIAVGGMQIAGYGLAGVLLIELPITGLFLIAAGASFIALLITVRGIGDHPPRAVAASAVRRAHTVNLSLLGSSDLRPVLLASWVPNGLIVGCESLFVPFAGRHAGYLFAATAAGMLLGDIVIGRFVSIANRDRLLEPLRFLLAAPYVLFLFHPSLAICVPLGFAASFGYAASLPLQERLVTSTKADIRGQVLGMNSTGMQAMQGIGALLAGTAAKVLGAGSSTAATAIGLTACASLAVTALLIPGLRRTRPAPPILCACGC